jgi:hypothetical protein
VINGYGPGIGIRMIAERCSTCTVHGIDFSQLMYKRASKYNKPFIDAGRVSLKCGDFLHIPVLKDLYCRMGTNAGKDFKQGYSELPEPIIMAFVSKTDLGRFLQKQVLLKKHIFISSRSLPKLASQHFFYA